IIFISKIDRENASFEKCMSQLKEYIGSSAVPLMVPIMNGMKMEGYVDLIVNKAYKYDKKGAVESEIPASLSDAVSQYREALLEAAVENDEELMEKYFSGEELTVDEIKRGLRAGIISGSTVPVTAGSAFDGTGVEYLLDCISEYMPSPAEGIPVSGVDAKGNTVTRKVDSAEPFSARVFKTVADPFVGKLSYIKVMSGTLDSDLTLYNPNAEKSEKTGTIYMLRGKKQTQIEKAHAGDICALAKLQYTQTGHTLCTVDNPMKYPMLDMPKPVISMAVAPKNQGDEDKVFSGLHRLEEEDLTFVVSKEPNTGEILISGVGESHLEVLTRKLFNKFNAEVVLSIPKVPYRET
ncbi:MAG TPA: EF-Tu/IF-2/RF-3 family GTPase, partial [Clostridia bacterium]|nr:EF-Tu/IF-2/RF-3 family GTPase [Clostridia bacterium]